MSGGHNLRETKSRVIRQQEESLAHELAKNARLEQELGVKDKELDVLRKKLRQFREGTKGFFGDRVRLEAEIKVRNCDCDFF